MSETNCNNRAVITRVLLSSSPYLPYHTPYARENSKQFLIWFSFMDFIYIGIKQAVNQIRNQNQCLWVIIKIKKFGLSRIHIGFIVLSFMPIAKSKQKQKLNNNNYQI